MFFNNLKVKIKELAKNAVLIAEEELGSGKGQQKKQEALDYIVGNLPVSSLLKTIITLFLSDFIDDAIESAVLYMNSLSNNKEINNAKQ